MGFLNFGKKNKDLFSAKALETLPIKDISSTKSAVLESPLEAVSSSNQPSNLSPEQIPFPSSLLDKNVSSSEPVLEKPVKIPEVSSDSVELPFEKLPDFSEDDFSAPELPGKILEDNNGTSFISKEQSPSESVPVVFNSSLSVEKQSTVLTASSFLAEQGVFVSRSKYLSLLNTLNESSKSIKLLKTRQNHLIDFDLSMKKLFEKESVGFENLHKDILAIMPFISKK